MADPDAAQDDVPAPNRVVPPPVRGRWRKSALWMAIEVVLISASVFLGLAGQQWLEDRQRREQANEALRRFRTEIVRNQEQIASKLDYHVALATALDAYVKADAAKKAEIDIPFTRSLNPPFFEDTAWQLALATQSLSDIPDDLAYVLSRIYYFQEVVIEQTLLMTQTLYLRPPGPGADGEAFLRAAESYYGDLTSFEPGLIEMYDVALKAIDEAVSE